MFRLLFPASLALLSGMGQVVAQVPPIETTWVQVGESRIGGTFFHSQSFLQIFPDPFQAAPSGRLSATAAEAVAREVMEAAGMGACMLGQARPPQMAMDDVWDVPYRC